MGSFSMYAALKGLLETKSDLRRFFLGKASPLRFKYSSKQNNYKSSINTTLFVTNNKQIISAIKAIFRLNTKS